MMIILVFTAFAGVAAVQPSFYRRNDDSCACKEWAWEATNTSNPPLQYKMYSKDSAKDLICKRFWEVLDTDRCINLNVGKDEGTWCYVDSSCKTLNGGSEIGDQVSWKKC